MIRIFRKIYRIRLRLIIPLSGIAIGLLFLIGCINLPIPEHTVNSNQKDFRPLVDTDKGGHVTDAGRIRVGITRDEVIRLLGDTPYKSKMGDTVVYFVDTEEGFYIGVTCLGPTQSSNALVLRYDPDGKILEIKRNDYGSRGTGLLTNIYEPFVSMHDDYLKERFPGEFTPK